MLDIRNLARGAAMEQFEAELDKVLANVLDPNTDYKKERKVTLSIGIKPNDEERESVTVTCTAKSTLVSFTPIKTQAYVGIDNGEYVMEEYTKGVIKGQISVDEASAESSKVVAMNKEAK